ncbi:hypothetical protein RHGRI_010269 [Rhododendron griersonianum]|uniref:Uncharacterized protein n=1 Tax=Rhododendron griersonianum TaxID=479676 RepID=A0AAV6KJ08_9ERIC|nr:hypothetical protein RHGRI_010269 [Rhododendron griersonianum]
MRYSSIEPKLVTADEIENGIRRLMENGDKSSTEGIKQKVKEMSEKSKVAIKEGGSSYNSIGRFIKDVIINDKFNIVGYDEKEHVRHGVDRKCKKLYRTWRHNMKDHYEALVEAGKDPYVNPYKGVSGEDWAWMIGNIWTNKEKEQLAADLFYFAAELNCSEKINAYDEKFARFEAVMSAYMHGNPIGAGSNCHLLEIMFLDRAW